MTPKIRVLCVDDHRVVRDGIGLVINREPDMEVVAAAASGEDALLLFRQHRPDITLMDLQLEAMTGIETIAALRREAPEARIIVLTMYEGDEDIHRALAAGAVTYLLKHTLSDELIDVVRQVHHGQRPISSDVAAKLKARASRPTLTNRETEVLDLVAQGLRNKQIADVLEISEETVEVHLRNIFAKLKVNERTGAVKVAVRRGIVHFK